MIEPVATMKVNTTIADLKAEYWREGGQDYYTPILLNSEGDSVVIGGRVISSDLQGNLFQQLIVEDETGVSSSAYPYTTSTKNTSMARKYAST